MSTISAADIDNDSVCISDWQVHYLHCLDTTMYDWGMQLSDPAICRFLMMLLTLKNVLSERDLNQELLV